MRKVAKGISVFAAWPLMLALLLGSIVTISFSEGIYASEHQKLGIAETIGCSPSLLEHVTTNLIGFMKNGSLVDLEMNGEINGERRQVFSEKEKQHMIDVKYLFDLAQYFMMIAIIAAALSVACTMLLGQPGRRLLDLVSGLLWGMASFALVVIVLGIVIFIDFSRFWTTFHQIFFINDLWQLDPSTDVLIQMMPEQFFIDMIIYIGAMFIGIAAVIAITAAVIKIVMTKRLAVEPVSLPARAPSDDSVTSIPAQDGERFVINTGGAERPAAEEIFQEFGLSDKDDKPLMPDETQTTRPLASMRQPEPQAASAPPAPVKEPEPAMEFVMPPVSRQAEFEPEKSYKLAEDEPAQYTGMRFVMPESSGDFEPFTDISSSDGTFKFFDDEQNRQEAPRDDAFTLRPGIVPEPVAAELAIPAEPESAIVKTPELPAAPEPVVTPEPAAAPVPVAAPEPESEPAAQPMPVAPGPVAAIKPVSAPHPGDAQATKKFVPIVEEEPETEVYTPGDERRPAPRRAAPHRARPFESLSVNVPVTIPASQVDISQIENGVKLELRLELRLREDGSLEPAIPRELQTRAEPAPAAPERAVRTEESAKAAEGPSVSELLAKMDQIMAGFPEQDGSDR